ncbi:MAG: hypothetical protein ACOY31_07990 [Bacillota bacterium]
MKKSFALRAGKWILLVTAPLFAAALVINQLAFAATAGGMDEGLQTFRGEDAGVYDVYGDMMERISTYEATGDKGVLSWEIPAGTYSVEISDEKFILKSK